MNRAYTVTRAVALLAVVVASFVDMRAQGRALPGGGSPATLTIDQAVREAVDHNLTLLPERFNDLLLIEDAPRTAEFDEIIGEQVSDGLG